jgi:hypothetical protein
LDRRGGLELANRLEPAFTLEDSHRVFGAETGPLGTSLPLWVDAQLQAAQLSSVKIWLHGALKDWDLTAWSGKPVCGRLRACLTPENAEFLRGT